VAFGVKVGVEGRPERAGRVGPDMGLRSEFVLDHVAQRTGVAGRIGDEMSDAFQPLDQGGGLWAIAALACSRDQPLSSAAVTPSTRATIFSGSP
jgi:hypothetical protein